MTFVDYKARWGTRDGTAREWDTTQDARRHAARLAAKGYDVERSHNIVWWAPPELEEGKGHKTVLKVTSKGSPHA